MNCSVCGKSLDKNSNYGRAERPICDMCAMKAGLFPLGHTGARRDGISEEGRVLCPPEPIK